MDNRDNNKASANHESHPILTLFSVVRSEEQALPGRYCQTQNVWLVDSSDGPMPLVMLSAPFTRVAREPEIAASAEPLTKVAREPEMAGLPVTQEVGKKTAVARESEMAGSPVPLEVMTRTFVVREPDMAGLAVPLEVMTKTEVRPERDEGSSFETSFLIELATKTDAVRERDD